MSNSGDAMDEQYYTLEEVIRKLDKSRSTVLREAKVGLIPSELEEGKKKGRRYPKQAIDALSEIQDERAKSKKPPRFVFSSSTVNDLWAEVMIAQDLYGEAHSVSYKRLLEWREANKKMYMSLKENSKVVGYASLMPLEEEAIQALLKDEIKVQDIPVAAVKQWRASRLSVYIVDMTVKPSGDRQRDTKRGAILLRQMIRWAVSLDYRYDIRNWYGVGATKATQQLFERLGFREVVTLDSRTRKSYHLEDAEEPVKLLRLFLKEVEQGI